MKTSLFVIAPFFLLLTACFYSCEKSVDPDLNGQDTTGNNSMRNDSVIIAGSNSDSILITSRDTVIEGYFQSDVSCNLDLNGDGTNDIALTIKDMGLVGTGFVPVSYIRCLHDSILIRNSQQTDTTWSSVSTDTVEANGSVILKIIATYHTNNFIPGDSLIAVNEVNHPVFNSGGDPIAITDPYLSAEFMLAYCPYTTPWMTYYENDILRMVRMELHTENCCFIPDETPVYIGFKLIDNGRTRLGWIKLSLKDFRQLHVYETAIQP